MTKNPSSSSSSSYYSFSPFSPLPPPFYHLSPLVLSPSSSPSLFPLHPPPSDAAAAAILNRERERGRKKKEKGAGEGGGGEASTQPSVCALASRDQAGQKREAAAVTLTHRRHTHTTRIHRTKIEPKKGGKRKKKIGIAVLCFSSGDPEKVCCNPLEIGWCRRRGVVVRPIDVISISLHLSGFIRAVVDTVVVVCCVCVCVCLCVLVCRRVCCVCVSERCAPPDAPSLVLSCSTRRRRGRRQQIEKADETRRGQKQNKTKPGRAARIMI